MAMIHNFLRAGKIASSGMRANRSWMNVIANNISNANTLDTGVRDASGNMVPYSRQVPVFSKVLNEQFRKNRVNGDVLGGVAVKDVVELEGKHEKRYDPSHPAARQSGPDQGYVYSPGVHLSQELADMRIAAASYEANLTVMSTTGQMVEQALSIGRR